MSDLPIDYRDQLNLREQIARIDNLLVENRKLAAETRRFNRDHWVLILAALLGIIAAFTARAPEIIQALR